MRNKYRNRLDMNKTGKNAIRLKADQLATCFKKLTDKKAGARFAVVFWK